MKISRETKGTQLQDAAGGEGRKEGWNNNYRLVARVGVLVPGGLEMLFIKSKARGVGRTGQGREEKHSL